MDLIWSRYNFLEEYKGRLLLYNSYTNNLFEFTTNEERQALLKLKSGEYNGVNHDFIADLEDNLIVVENEDLLINKIKLARLSTRFTASRMNLTIAPTVACNFACPYCYEEGAAKNKIMNKDIEDLIVKLVSSYKGLERLNIDWYGGEPLLAFNIIKSLSNRLMALPVREYKATLITNGYLLDENKILQLKELQISRLQITIDGLEKTHNQRRPHKTNNDSYIRILTNIDSLCELYPEAEIHIRVNIDKNNSDDFFQLFDHFKSKFKNPKSFVYPAYITEFNPCKTSFCMMNRTDQAEFALKNLDKYPFSRFYYPVTKLGECTARFMNSFVIGPEAELYKCWCDVGEESKSIGNLIEGITNSSLYTQYMTESDPLFDEKCTNCSYFPICNGGCAFRRLKNKYNEELDDVCTIQKGNMGSFIRAYYDSL